MPDRIVTRAWDTAWEGTPSWETGRPQPVVERLLAEGAFAGRVLDAGCGSGRHAVLLALAGHRVTGLDVAPAAIERARAAVAAAGLADGVTLLAGDVLAEDVAASVPGAPFDTILDVGLLHVLQPVDRAPYAGVLAALARPGATALVVAWSDRNPFGYGPSRVRRRDLWRAFTRATGWRVDAIEETRLESRLAADGAHAWLMRATRR